MFMRTVKMFIKQNKVQDFRALYEEHVLGAFSKVRGCRYGALLQSTQNPEECISLTFWTSEAYVHAYEQSGEYEQLVKILSPHFSESSELQIRLTKDLKIEYSSSKDPEVRTFELAYQQDSKSTGEILLRMVSLKFREGKVEEFKKHYEENVIPVLCSIKGCRRAFLAAPSDSPNELISVTEWEDERAAQAYEHGGQFDAILQSQRHFFSGLSNWGMTGQKRTGNRVATSDDVRVDRHHLLVGRSFLLTR